MPKTLLYITTYDPHASHLGGASWVDRKVVDLFAESFDVSVMTVADPHSPEDLPLEVRGDRPALARTLSRMMLRGEPYQEAKFKFNGRARTVADRLRLAAGAADRVVTSQFPALLMAHEAGVIPDVHIAHNVDWQLSHEHDPRLLRMLGNANRLQSLEERLVSAPDRVWALSTVDVERLRSWGVYADHLPLGVRGHRPAGRGARTVGLLGKMSWPPNRQAVRQLLDVIIPQVTERTGERIQVVLAGSGSEAYHDAAAGVLGLGRVETLDDFYDRVDVAVIPRYGETSGVSVKMLEALERGLDVLAPAQLARDAGIPESWILQADTPEQMVSELAHYLTGVQSDGGGEPLDADGGSETPDREIETPSRSARWSSPSDAIERHFVGANFRDRLVRTDAALLDLAFKGGTRVQTVNLHHLHLLTQNGRFAEAMWTAGHVTADGWPVRRFAEQTGLQVDRVTGAAFIENLVRDPRVRGRRVALVGGTAAGVDAFERGLDQAGATLVYRNTGPKTEWIPAMIADQIRAAGGADIILLAVTPPFGDIFAMMLEAELPGPFYINIGGGLAMFAGEHRRAHPLIQQTGLEWLHRLAQDPRRLARRYLIECPPVLLAMRAAHVRPSP